MMLSIMSLIRETLGSGNTAKDSAHAAQTPATHGAAAVKVDNENDFRAILSDIPTSAQPCMSAHRIKTATAHDAKDDGDEHETTCMSPDDFLAWAFNAQSATQTLPAPTPMTGSSTTLQAVNGGNAALHAFENATTEDIRGFDGREIFGNRPEDGSIQPQASILEPLLAQHPAAPASSDPSSGELARNASKSNTAADAELAQSNGDRVSITKLARSKSATEVPPPSVLPTVDADDLAPPTTRTDLRATVMAPPHELPREAHPTTQMAAVSAPSATTGPQTRGEDMMTTAHAMAQANAAAPQHARISAANGSNDLHDLPTRPEMRAKSVGPRPIASKTEPSLEAQPAPAAAATPAARIVPVLLPPVAAHDTVAMARVDVPARASEDEARDASDARQRAAVHAVNQLTLKKSAGGEIDIPELGKVRVEAEAKAGKVDVSIQADRSETRALMSAHTREITADARAAAIPVNAVRVGGANGSGDASMNFSSSSQDAPRRENERAKDEDAAQNTMNAPLANKRARFVL